MNAGENFYNWAFTQLKYVVPVLFLAGLIFVIPKRQVSLLITYGVIALVVCTFLFFPMQIMEAFSNIGNKIVGASVILPPKNSVAFVDTRILRNLFSMRTFV